MKRYKALVIALAVSFSTALPTVSAASESSVQVGFSPEGTARVLVLSAIDSAKQSIRMMAYSFTSPDIVRALINAKKRGVDVKIVIDDKGNHGRASMAAMNLVVNAGIPLRTDSAYPIQHDKVIVIDEESVETGSFNFTASAEKRNSENAIVIWEMPNLAKAYLDHWQSRWDKGQDFKSSY